MDFSYDIKKEKTDKLIADMVYEIQTQINTIIKLSKRLLKGSLDAEQRWNVENIKNAGITINSIAKDIVELSGAEMESTLFTEKNIIDTEKGMIFFSDNKDEYMNILKTVYTDGQRQLNTMKDCIDRQDFKSYINEIYSLKSISANIGAKSLSKIVQTHESAYNSQDYDFIISNFSMLADTYQKVISEIKIILCSETIFNDKPETENYSENYSNTGIALIKAAEFIDNFEIQSAKSQLEKLFDSDETDWIKKQVIKRAIKMIDNCCYQDTRNLVIAMAEGEKF